MPIIAQFSLLQWEAPGTPRKTVGVLLFDQQLAALHWKFTHDWSLITTEETDQQYLALISVDLMDMAVAMGAEAFLVYMENTLSGALSITDRQTVFLEDLQSGLIALFNTHVAGENSNISEKALGSSS